ncbi:MAG: cytosine permease [Caldivirga sp.]
MGETINTQSTVIYNKERGQLELTVSFPEEKYLWNRDLHPTPIGRRTWDWYTYAAIWFSMAFIVPSWSLASVGLSFGLGTLESIMVVFLGNLIVLVPMIIQSHGGARYGIPEPVLTRTRWGVYGAIFPSWIRAIIGAGWWGIETYIMTEAAVGIYAILSGKLPALESLVARGIASPFTISLAFPQVFWVTFVLIILLQLALLYHSPVPNAQPALKWFARLSAPLILAGFLALWLHFMSLTHWGYGSIFAIHSSLSGSTYWMAWLAFLNANIAYWATMALSMPDYTRFAKSQLAQTAGQIPMPFMMLAVAVLGTMTTGAVMRITGHPIWDPILLATLYMGPIAGVTVNLLFLLATFAVNVFANTVGPAYDFANTLPRYITWFRGVLIVVAVAVALGAWTFYGSAYGYLYNWLLTYGGLLGSVEGIIIFDYALIRRFKFELGDVFLSRGRFRYWMGINPAAFITFAVVTFIIYAPIPYHAVFFNNAWILAFILSGLIYTPLMVYWVIPRYQPHLRGSIWRGGYVSDEVKEIFK